MPAATASHPNILLIACDQLRAFELGCYGNPIVRTPHLDGLAASGTRFETAVSNAPVCTPARSILLSGQYARTCAGMTGNVHDNPPNPQRARLLNTTLPEALRLDGYQTALIGKWHLDPQPQLVGFEQAVYPDFEHRYYAQRYWNERGESWIVDEFANDFDVRTFEQFLAEKRAAPFFAFFNIGQPHQPIGPGHLPERYCTMYDPAAIQLRPNVPTRLNPDNARFWFNVYTSADFFWRHLSKQPQRPNDLVGDDFDIRALAALYCGAVTLVDDTVGRVLAALQASGQAEKTIVAFVSDHGDNLGSHGKFNKNDVIEESIRVPLLVYDPRHPGGRVIDTGVASLIDVMPTLLELAEVTIPDGIQGTSLAAAVRGENALTLPGGAIIETGSRLAVRSSTHLYAIEYDENSRCPRADGARHLFDLCNDPYELNNLADDDRQQEERQRLDRQLRHWDSVTPWLDAPPARGIADYLQSSHWMQHAQAEEHLGQDGP